MPHPATVPPGTDIVDWLVEHRIEQLYAKQGEFGALLLLATNWADWTATKKSDELLRPVRGPPRRRVERQREAAYRWVTDHQQEITSKRVSAAEQKIAKHEAEQAEKRRV
jgi:limonene 1,2-monooxygenase